MASGGGGGLNPRMYSSFARCIYLVFSLSCSTLVAAWGEGEGGALLSRLDLRLCG